MTPFGAAEASRPANPLQDRRPLNVEAHYGRRVPASVTDGEDSICMLDLDALVAELLAFREELVGDCDVDVASSPNYACRSPRGP